MKIVFGFCELMAVSLALLNVSLALPMQSVHGSIKPDFQGLTRNVVSDEGRKWPNATVPYHIDTKFSEIDKEVIRKAMRGIENVSCVQFHKADIERAQFYVRIVSVDKGCSAHVGYAGEEQTIKLSDGCIYSGTITHELLHTLGFEHQHVAANRDEYIDVLYDNIKENRGHNFVKKSSNEITDFGLPYDFESIMHYREKGFSKNNEPTIEVKEKFGYPKLGENKMSEIDIMKLNCMYHCKECTLNNI